MWFKRQKSVRTIQLPIVGVQSITICCTSYPKWLNLVRLPVNISIKDFRDYFLGAISLLQAQDLHVLELHMSRDVEKKFQDLGVKDLPQSGFMGIRVKVHTCSLSFVSILIGTETIHGKIGVF